MRINTFSVCVALLLIFLGSCNLFNPTGASTFADDDDADAIIEYGNDLLRQNKYSEAEGQFNKALKLDSTKSEAYFGLAKAKIRGWEINPFELLGFVSPEEGEIPFVSEPNSTKNRYYQGLADVQEVFDIWVNKDTLTELWEYSKQKMNDTEWWNDQGESFQSRVNAFESTYGTYGNTSLDFPLSDRKVKYSRIQIDHAITSFITTVLGFLDLNGDGQLDENDLDIGITRDENGNITVDVEKVVEQAVTNPEVAENLNDKLETLASGSDDVGQIIADLSSTLGGGATGGDGTDSALSDEATEELQAQIDDMGDAVLFYKMGDQLDNDGDGCFDEEIYDSLDNDRDGFIDEDLRIAQIDPTNPITYGVDLVDNDFNGTPDDAGEVFLSGVVVDTDEKIKDLGFVSNFVANVNGEVNTEDRMLKLRVAQDTLGTVYSLQDRKDSIGGCWSYYDEEMFQSYLTANRAE